MTPVPEEHPIRHLFRGLVENAFQTEIGLCEPRLTDYLAGLMVEFIHMDRLTYLHRMQARNLERMVALLSLAGSDEPLPPEQKEFNFYRGVGDFSLFWSGIFPEHLRSPGRRDRLGDFVIRGKQSYAAAAKMADESWRPPASLLSSLSEEFETCVHGLGLVRQSWQERTQKEGGELLL